MRSLTTTSKYSSRKIWRTACRPQKPPMTPLIDRLVARVRATFQKPALDAELDAELDHHLEILIEKNLADGLSPAEARRRARIQLGSVEQIRELHRETRGLP